MRINTPHIIMTLGLLSGLIAPVAHAEGTKLGLGLSASPGQDQPPEILLPIHFGDAFVFEPAFHGNFEARIDGYQLTFQFGTGWLYKFAHSKHFNLHTGARLGFTWSQDVNRGDALALTRSSTDLWMGAVMGCEWFVHPQLSLGGEAGLQLLYHGDIQLASRDNKDNNIETTRDAPISWQLDTPIKVQMRWYF